VTRELADLACSRGYRCCVLGLGDDDGNEECAVRPTGPAPKGATIPACRVGEKLVVLAASNARNHFGQVHYRAHRK